MRYMNMYRTMKEIIDSGAIGEVKAVWVRHFVGLGSDYYYHSLARQLEKHDFAAVAKSFARRFKYDKNFHIRMIK